MTQDVRAIGARVRTLRMAKNLGLTELADAVRISKGYLSELETGGDVNPTLDVLKRLADKLGVTLADLLDTPKTRAKMDVPAELPAGLRELVREWEGEPLEAATVVWLANAQFRGQRPKTKDDFLHVLMSLRGSTRKK